MKRDLLSFADLTRAEADRLFDVAARLKADLKAGRDHRELSRKTLGLIFHKPSLRTRLSFEVAMTQLGGSSIFITEREIGMGSRESVADVARVLSGYVDGIMIRTFQHDLCESLARYASVPVINGLTDWLHPCQILADLFTLRERGFDLDRIKVAFIGDGNNVANSWIEAAMLYGLEVRIACPEGYEPDPKLSARVSETGKGSARVLRSPFWDHPLTRAAKRVLVTAERLVPTEALAAQPELTLVPGFLVEAAAIVPRGAWPGSMHPLYEVDYPAVEAYLTDEPGALEAHLAAAPEQRRDP